MLFQQTPVLRFIVAVFMADDSVGVWELKSRNSGHDEARCYAKLGELVTKWGFPKMGKKDGFC